MKIAYIYDAVYPWIKGGAEKRIYEIKPFFRKESFTKEIVFLLALWGSAPRPRKPCKGLVFFCKKKKCFLIKLFLKVCGIKWWEGERDIAVDGVYLHGIGNWDNLYVNGRRSIKEAIT